MSGRRRRSHTRGLRRHLFSVSRKRHAALGARLQLASFDERIAPLAQRRNVHVDPIIPPIERARVVTKIGSFIFRQRRPQAFDVRRFENMIVVQNERLEKRNQLDDFLQFPFARASGGFDEGIGSAVRLMVSTIAFWAGAESLS